MNDIAEIFHSQIEFGVFSLDQVMNDDYLFYYNPFQQMTYSPKRLQNTNYIATMFFTDYILKMITQSSEMSSNIPFKQINAFFNGFMSKLPNYLQKNLNLQHFRQVAFENELKRKAEKAARRFGKNSNDLNDEDDDEESKNMQDSKVERMRGKAHRFWIENDTINFKMDQSSSSSDKTTIKVTLGDARMKIKKHLLKLNEKGELVDDEKDSQNCDQSGEAMFARSFTNHYNEFGKYFPIFNRLKCLIKLSSVFRLLMSQYSAIKEMKTKVESSYNEIKTKIDNALYDMRNDVVKNITHWPINCQANIDYMLDETLKLNNVSRWQVESSELSRVTNNIRNNVDSQQTEFINTIYDALCRSGGLDTSSYNTHYTIKNNIYQWISNGKSNTSKYYDSAHSTIVNYIADHAYNKQLKPLKNILKEMRSLGLHLKIKDDDDEEDDEKTKSSRTHKKSKRSRKHKNHISNGNTGGSYSNAVDYVPTIFTDLSKINYETFSINNKELKYLVFGGVLLNPSLKHCNYLYRNNGPGTGMNRFINIGTIGRGGGPGRTNQVGFGKILSNQLAFGGTGAVKYYNQTVGNAMRMANQAAYNQRQANVRFFNNRNNNNNNGGNRGGGGGSGSGGGGWKRPTIREQALALKNQYLTGNSITLNSAPRWTAKGEPPHVCKMRFDLDGKGHYDGNSYVATPHVHNYVANYKGSEVKSRNAPKKPPSNASQEIKDAWPKQVENATQQHIRLVRRYLERRDR